MMVLVTATLVDAAEDISFQYSCYKSERISARVADAQDSPEAKLTITFKLRTEVPSAAANVFRSPVMKIA